MRRVTDLALVRACGGILTARMSALLRRQTLVAGRVDVVYDICTGVHGAIGYPGSSPSP
jgi:hypothetical protein